MNRRNDKAWAAVFLGAGVLMSFLLPVWVTAVLLAAVLIVVGIFCGKC